MSDEPTRQPSHERRVAELLARAEDFRRHGEDGSADAALALAEKIMIKYALDAAVVATRGSSSDRPTEPIVVKTVNVTGIYRVVLSIQLSLLAQAASTTIRSFTAHGDRTEHVYLVGHESEVSGMLMLLTSIQLQAIAGMSHWWTALPASQRLAGMPGYKTRRQFVSSFVEGARDRIELARTTALGQHKPGTDVALATRRRLVDEYVDANFRLSSRRAGIQPGSREAANAGLAAGRRANTGDPSVGNVRRQITS